MIGYVESLKLIKLGLAMVAIGVNLLWRKWVSCLSRWIREAVEVTMVHGEEKNVKCFNKGTEENDWFVILWMWNPREREKELLIWFTIKGIRWGRLVVAEWWFKWG